MKVWLDDIRPAPEGYFHAYLPVEVIELLEEGIVTEIDLDHDLGDGSTPERTGYDVLAWLEEALAANRFPHPTPRIYLHTDNPTARERMKRAVNSISRFSRRK